MIVRLPAPYLQPVATECRGLQWSGSANHHDDLHDTRGKRKRKQPHLVPCDETQDHSQLRSKDPCQDPNCDQPNEYASHCEAGEQHGAHATRSGQEADHARRESEGHHRGSPPKPPLEDAQEPTGSADPGLNPGKHRLAAPPSQEVAKQIDRHEAHEGHGEERQGGQPRGHQHEVAKPWVKPDEQQGVPGYQQWCEPVRHGAGHDGDAYRQQKRQGPSTRAFAGGRVLAHPNMVTRRGAKSAAPFVATLVRSIFAPARCGAVCAQLRRVLKQLGERSPRGDAGGRRRILAFAVSFAQCKQIWSNKPQEPT